MPQNKISSSMFFMKRVFPAIWFGFLVVFATFGISAVLLPGVAGEFEPGALMFVLTPVFMAVFGYVLMKHMIWDLADEVYDHGDYLVVKNRGDEIRVDLTDIVNVSVSTLVNPPRITLRLRQATKFGNEVSFSPLRPFSLSPFAKNEIGENLIVRVDQARLKSKS